MARRRANGKSSRFDSIVPCRLRCSQSPSSSLESLKLGYFVTHAPAGAHKPLAAFWAHGKFSLRQELGALRSRPLADASRTFLKILQETQPAVEPLDEVGRIITNRHRLPPDVQRVAAPFVGNPFRNTDLAG